MQESRSTATAGARRAGAGLMASVAGFSLLAGCAQSYPTTPTLTTAPPATASTARPTTAVPGSCQEAASKLGVPEQAGLVVLVGLPGAPDATTTALIASDHLGGVVLTGAFKTGVAGVKGITGPLAASGLLVAAAQEGGTFQTLTGPGFDTIPPAAQQDVNDAVKLRGDWATWGGQLKDAGVHLDLAPGGDVLAPDNQATAPAGSLDAVYGTDPGSVAGIVSSVIKGLRQGGVAASATHFPGTGAFIGAATPPPTDTVTRPSSESLAAYRTAASAGVEVITVSPATYAKIDAASPAVFSPAVMSLLRDDLRFAGVIASADLASTSLASVPSGDRLVRFVKAGGDMGIVSDPAQVDAMVQALASAAASDKAVAARLQDAAGNVLALRAKAGLATCTAVKG
jgi:beta-N-acetylhexosaminidase